MIAYIFFSLIAPSLLFLPILYFGAKEFGEYTSRKGIKPIDAGHIGGAVGGVIICLLITIASIGYSMLVGN